MIKFRTIIELRSERNRLNNKKEMLAEEIKLDFEEVKESLKPMNMIKDLFTPDKHAENGQPISPVMANLGSTVFDLLFSRLMFNKSSYIKKLISSYLIHATGPSVLQKYGPTVVNMVKGLFNKFKNRHNSHPLHEQSTAGNWYD